MSAIIRREFSAYFRSPIGYIYLAVFYFFAGLFFTTGPLRYDTNDIATVFGSMFLMVLFLIPILTMRLFSEDLRHKTDQALLTAPISLTSLVLGKFFAAVCVYVLGMSVILVQALVLAAFTPMGWAMVLGNFLALLLLGMSLISIGMLISATTENQVVAATGGFAAGFALLLVDALSSVTQNKTLLKIIDGLSFTKRYQEFASGIFDLPDLFFFLSVCAVFLFLTVRVFENRRWN